MRKIKILLLTFFITLSSFNNTIALAQEVINNSPYDTENVQTTDETSKEKKKDKKKKDDKDYVKENVEINQYFLINFLINLATVTIIVGLIYFPNYRKQEVFFTYFLFNIAIFLLTFLLNKIKISIGAAFGLFAVFSMLRYRTEGISMKDMTYLFIVISVGLIGAIQLPFTDLLIIDSIFILFVYLLDGNILIRREYSKVVYYEKIEMIKPEKHNELIEDLKQRTGLEIHHVSIVRIDFLRDIAILNVYYYNKSKTDKSSDSYFSEESNSYNASE